MSGVSLSCPLAGSHVQELEVMESPFKLFLLKAFIRSLLLPKIEDSLMNCGRSNGLDPFLSHHMSPVISTTLSSLFGVSLVLAKYIDGLWHKYVRLLSR